MNNMLELENEPLRGEGWASQAQHQPTSGNDYSAAHAKAAEILILHPADEPASAAALGAVLASLGIASNCKALNASLCLPASTQRVVLLAPTTLTVEAATAYYAEVVAALQIISQHAKPIQRLMLVTQQAHSIASEAPQPALTALWGLLRSARRESVAASVVCVDAEDMAQDAAKIVQDLFRPEAEEYAYRQGKRYARVFDELPASKGSRPIRAEATYLITGGLGDMGLQLAGWLVEHGARHVLLLGRSGPDPQQVEAIAALQQQANIHVWQADVADAAAVSAVFQRAAAELPAIVGILHAAGIRRDALLANQDEASIKAVWQAKVQGALNLWQESRDLALDGLVLVSSLAASVGSAGQANYAAANAWLDAFAIWAAQQGVPAHSIAFGPWQDTGMVRELDAAQRAAIEQQGVQFQSAADSLDALAALWHSDVPHLLAYAGPLPNSAPTVAVPASLGDDALASVVAAIGKILRLPANKVDATLPLVSLGLDSLMAVELRNWCRTQYQVEVSTVELVRDVTAQQLAERIAASRGQTAEVAAAVVVDAGTDAGTMALSLGQRAQWYLHKLDPTSAAYHIALTVRVRSTVDVAALRATLQQLMLRHAPLRTVYRETEGGPVQEVLADAPDVFSQHEVSGDEAALLAQVRALYQQPFDLAQGPVLRVALCSRADDDHVLLFAMHHIAADAWSLWRIMEELRQVYAAHAEGQTLALPALAYRYADKLRDEVAYLASPQAASAAEYWQRELSGELPILNLPTDFPRPSVQTLRGASVQFALSTHNTERLLQLAKREGTTLFALLLAAYQTLLHRYSGQDDILIGCPTAGRNRSEAAATVGYFVNPIVIRSQLAAQSFSTLLHHVRGKLLDGLAQQDYPFPLLAERLAAARSSGHPPVFQAAFVMQQMQEASDFTLLLAPSDQPQRVDWGGLQLEFFGMPQQEGQFDLTLEMVQAHGACHGLFKYNSDLWQAATIERMAAHFCTLLQAILAAPDTTVDRLVLLPAAEQAVLQSWNATAQPYDLSRPLHTLIEAQVVRSPDAIAAQIGDAQISYRQLNNSANRIAGRLRGLGVQPDDMIGICAERSLELVVGLVGILKSGGAYVPLDTAHPADRLKFMVADMAAKALLVTAETRALLAAAAPNVLLLDIAEFMEGDDVANLPAVNTPHSLAYTIFTSGSTGQPKGAMNTHRGIVNRLLWMQEAFALMPQDRVLQKTPYSFDVSVWEFFWPLFTGARIVLAKPEGHRDNAYLATLIREQQITTLHFVPPMLTAFIEAPGAADCRSLKRVICSGQELPASLQRRFFATLPHSELHNLYGPTEAAVDVTWHACRADDERAMVPIGKPIANTQIHILDAHLQPVPIGVSGELYIGGVQVARGYLNRAELSAEKFIADPFNPGEQLYRSGDLARWLADGSIEYLGRTDFQVKLRGLRVELGEIENALTNLPQVQAAIVLLQEPRPGVKRLTAYVAAARNDEAAWRNALTATLPAYMLPDVFMRLDALPLTSNGKVNRKALPIPLEAASQVSHAPETAAEHKLAAIWQALLHCEQVGRDDNFFNLGGDSILVTQLVFRAQKQGFNFAIRDVLEQPTLKALARFCAEETSAVVVQREVDLNNIPLSPMQSWFFAASSSARFNQAIVLQAKQALDANALQQALDDIVARHDALRLRFVRDAAGVLRQHCVSPQASQIALAHWSPSDTQPLQAALDTCQQSFNLAHGPLFAALLIADPAAPRLMLAAHHLVIDGYAWRVLLADLELAYQARSTNKQAQFDQPAAAWADWAQTLAEFAASSAAEAEALYWLTEDWHSASVLPPEHANQAGVGDIALTLPVTALGADLDNASLEASLLAALAEVLAPQQDRLRIDREGLGREPLPGGPDGSQIVGWCTALYPVQLATHGADSLARREAVLASLADIPAGGRAFGLCRHSSPRPRIRNALARIAPAEILFNYLGRLDTTLPGERLFSFAPMDAGALRDPDETPRYPLEINVFRLGDTLHLSLRYDRARLAADWVQALAQRWSTALSGEQQQAMALTPMQQGMLFIELYTPQAGLYVTQLALQLAGDLDAPLLRCAWQQVLQRHPMLRHGFAWKGLAAPQQQAFDELELPWTEEDGRELSAAETEALIAQRAAETRQQGFDLTKPPLMRLYLLHTKAGGTLLWSHHHLLLDGRSMFNVLHEVAVCYAALRNSQPPQLAAVGNFRSFIGQIAKVDRNAALDYWRSQLADIDAATPIPFLQRASEPPTPPVAAELALQLSADASHAITALARRAGVTLGYTMQALLGLLLQRYSGQRSVVFGATLSDGLPDSRPDLSWVGMFINTIPVRVDSAAEGLHLAVDRLVPWLQQGFRKQAGRAAFEQTPLVDIQPCSGIAAGQPLFELLFLFENYSLEPALHGGFADLSVQNVQVIERTNLPITLSILPGKQISMRLVHDTTRYSATAAQLLLDSYVCLLQSASAASDDAVLADLQTVDAAQRQRLLIDWNATAAPYPQGVGVHNLFLAQAAAQPAAVAIRYRGTSVTYAELAHRAQQIAHSLAARGIGRGDCIGVFTERHPDMVAALFAIMLTGAAYLPLDPAFPPERLSYMLQNAGASLVLTDQQVDRSLHDDLAKQAPMLALESIAADAPADFSPRTPQGDELMYIIYTSGSTGQPKGVMVPQRTVVNFLTSMAREPGITANDTLLAVTTLSFDISVLELFLPLLNGARVVLAERAARTDPKQLIRLLRDENVSILQATPATWRMLFAAGWQGQAGLRALSGGEALANDLSRDILAGCDSIWNVYGPTETTVWSTLHQVQREQIDGDGVAPIGHPIANTAIYVLDERQQLLPIGAIGELHIGGQGVTLGYRGRDDLSAERFLANPFQPDDRIYRTGDRARLAYNGTLEYLGRFDDQVKLRGYRIELGEIESALGRHPAITHACALIRPDQAGELQLVAYIATPDHPAGPTEAELKDQLRQRLPEYMVPSRIVSLPTLPLTPNGKVNRKALPEPLQRETPPPTGASLGTDLEQQISAIWATALGPRQFALDESFFNAGGNSLHLIQMQSKLMQVFGIELEIVELFSHPTIRDLAALIGQRRGHVSVPVAGGHVGKTARSGDDGPRSQRDIRREARTRHRKE